MRGIDISINISIWEGWRRVRVNMSDHKGEYKGYEGKGGIWMWGEWKDMWI